MLGEYPGQEEGEESCVNGIEFHFRKMNRVLENGGTTM
jgi:hypothetical protein